MNKRLFVSGLLLSCLPLLMAAAAPQNPATVESNWNLTRTTFKQDEKGITLKQTEKGTPSNHAIAILEVPFDGVDEFEIVLKFRMDEFVATGKSANDVWSGVGIMGKPTFINWQNTEAAGWAKDTPGFFTRFMNYAGDLGVISDVFQENYHYDEAHTVDTWTVLNTSADATINEYVEIKLKKNYHQETATSFYDFYINDKNLTENGEISTIDSDIMFPDGKMYLMLAMNTEDKEINDLSSVTIREINGESLAGSKEENGSSSSKKGCGGSILTSSIIVGVTSLLGLSILAFKKRKEQ